MLNIPIEVSLFTVSGCAVMDFVVRSQRYGFMTKNQVFLIRQRACLWSFLCVHSSKLQILLIKDVENHDSVIIVTLRDTKTKIDRTLLSEMNQLKSYKST